MPLYEYECKKCHHRFEKIQKFSDRMVKKCPKCGATALEQMVSAPAVQFKGTGWYVTDYAKKSSAPASSSSGDSSSKGESSDSASKSESSGKKEDKTKSESKSESKESKKSEKKS